MSVGYVAERHGLDRAPVLVRDAAGIVGHRVSRISPAPALKSGLMLPLCFRQAGLSEFCSGQRWKILSYINGLMVVGGDGIEPPTLSV